MTSTLLLYMIFIHGQGDADVLPFTMILNDPAGNSFLENPSAPSKDPNIKLTTYTRTKEQDESLGLKHETAQYRDPVDTNYAALLGKKHSQEFIKEPKEIGAGGNPAGPDVDIGTKRDPLGSLEKDIVSFPALCPSCGVMGESLTAMTDIPHFKEVMIMAFTCDSCGYRNSEMKAGGAVPLKGTEVTLSATRPSDMTRDVLKSDSAMVKIPELDLELQHGTLGGVYTTVEGLLVKIKESLVDNNPFYSGDSSRLHHYTGASITIAGDNEEDSAQPYDVRSSKARYADFLKKLDDVIEGNTFPFHMIIRDPLGNSFISSEMGAVVPPEMDKALTTEDFIRTWQEDEDFGLNDMDTGEADKAYDGGKASELPDRLTHVYPKLPDHPFRFAQGGIGDSTPGGITFGNSDSNATSEVEPEVPVGKRQFSDDSEIEFLPYENFSGKKSGCVFRLGSKGLGYYKDVRKNEPVDWEPPVNE